MLNMEIVSYLLFISTDNSQQNRQHQVYDLVCADDKFFGCSDNNCVTDVDLDDFKAFLSG